MAILQASELANYASDIPTNIAAQAIRKAQILAESAAGANRPLELTVFKETLAVNRNTRTVWLNHLPIDESYGITVEIQFGAYELFRRQIPASNWVTLEPDAYRMDFEQGVVYLLTDRLYDFEGVTIEDYRTLPRKARVTYRSGFDFTESNRDTERIKTALGMIAQMQSGEGASAAYGGATAFTLERVYSVSYAQPQVRGDSGMGISGGGAVAGVIDDYLGVFRSYRPRSFCL